MPQLKVRRFIADDAGATAHIFFDAVRLGTTRYYDERQRNAWAVEVPDNDAWLERLQSQHTFVAEYDTRLVGFMTLDKLGHIDLAFVVPDLMGKGVARSLYKRLEAEALKLGIGKLDTEASHLARRFFERQGWSVVREQSVSMGEVALTNFVMDKRLN